MDSVPTSAWRAERGEKQEPQGIPFSQAALGSSSFQGVTRTELYSKGIPLNNCNQPVWSRESGWSGAGRVAGPSLFAGRASRMDAPARPGRGRRAGSNPPADTRSSPFPAQTKGLLTALG